MHLSASCWCSFAILVTCKVYVHCVWEGCVGVGCVCGLCALVCIDGCYTFVCLVSE